MAPQWTEEEETVLNNIISQVGVYVFGHSSVTCDWENVKRIFDSEMAKKTDAPTERSVGSVGGRGRILQSYKDLATLAKAERLKELRMEREKEREEKKKEKEAADALAKDADPTIIFPNLKRGW